MVHKPSKYDALARGFAETSYANLEFYMRRRFDIVRTWGITLKPGDSILELGCGDGYLAKLLVEHGLGYCGVDFSPRMVEVAAQRLDMAGLHADFMVTDVSNLELSRQYDAVIAYMRTFFTYARDPLTVVQRLRPYVGKKLILDLNPRRDISPASALALLKRAGFSHVAWRPFFVPEKKQLPSWLLASLAFCEDVPFVREVPLRWKFNCLVIGEP